jgi:hypothetical protein
MDANFPKSNVGSDKGFDKGCDKDKRCSLFALAIPLVLPLHILRNIQHLLQRPNANLTKRPVLLGKAQVRH